MARRKPGVRRSREGDDIERAIRRVLYGIGLG